MENIKFKSIDEIVSKISEKTSSYTNSGVLDMSMFYSDIHNLLRKLGEYYQLDKVEVLKLNGIKAKLPKDFIRLKALYIAENYKESEFAQTIKSYTLPIIEKDKVDYIQVTEKTNVEIPKSYLCKGSVLRYNGKAGKLIDEDCLNYNSKSSEEFRIDKNYIYTNISDKKLIIEYLAFALDEEGLPLIPDNPKTEEAIENMLLYKIFEYLYINRLADVSNEMKYYEQKASFYFAEAMTYTKLPEEENIGDYYEAKRKYLRRYE